MIDEADFQSRLRAVRQRIDPATLALLREAHEAYDFGCAAHSEGQGCCLDWLLADGPEPHQVSRVAAGAKSCTPPPCPPEEGDRITVKPWVPSLAELYDAGAAIMQPDGSHYVERDGEVIHVQPREEG